MDTKKYTFTPRSADAVKKRASGSTSDKILKDGIKQFTATEGENVLRILYNNWEAIPKHYGYDVWVHYGVGADKGQYLCLEKMKVEGGKCPMCEGVYKKAKADFDACPSTDKARKEELRIYMNSVAPKRQVALWIINRAQEDLGPQLFLMTGPVDRQFIALSIDPTDRALIQVENPSEGYDIIFTRTGKALNTKYTNLLIARRPSPLGTEDQMAKWVAFIDKHRLPNCFVTFSFDHINAVYNAQVVNKVDGEEIEDDSTTEEHTTSHEAQSVEEHETSSSEVVAESSPEAPTWTYEELASLSKVELINFVKETQILGMVDLKLSTVPTAPENKLLLKVCEKMGITVPVVSSVGTGYKDKLNATKEAIKK